MATFRTTVSKFLNSYKGLGLTMVFSAATAGYFIGTTNELYAERNALRAMTPEQIHTTHKDICINRTAKAQAYEQIEKAIKAGNVGNKIDVSAEITPALTQDCAEHEHERTLEQNSASLNASRMAPVLFGMFSALAFGQMIGNYRRRTEKKNEPQPKP